ncbi:MAG: GYF domain-containing protein [Bacteriovoracaceae bacterium]
MADNWYYVERGERKGPITHDEMEVKIQNKFLGESDYVWKKGFENTWKKIKDVPELYVIFNTAPITSSIPEIKFDMKTIIESEKVFLIKTGPDRNGEEKEYGPFSLNMLKTLLKDERINGKTLVYAPGMGSWMFLAELPNYRDIFQAEPPEILEQDRRQYKRKPFIARMFFHDNKKVYEGICRDVSVGGMQIMIADFPGRPGDKISLNVHPENADFHFVASGKIVRMLDSDSGFSFRFTDLGQDAVNAITRFVNEQ